MCHTKDVKTGKFGLFNLALDINKLGNLLAALGSV